MNLSDFKQQLQQLENKLLVEYNLTDKEIIVSITMVTKELGDTCSFVEAIYNSTVHQELLVIEGRHYF